MTDLNNSKLNKLLPFSGNTQAFAWETKVISGPSFLRLTSEYEIPKVAGVVYASEEVLSGEVQDEIDKILSEENAINSALQANSTSSINDLSQINRTFEAKTLVQDGDDTGSSERVISSKTDTSNLFKNISYSPNYNTYIQKKIIEGGLNTMVEWLDDYINNYDTKVAEGRAKGESEVKLSFLLRLRKAIENCDFPIGFGYDEYFEQNSGDGYVVLGAYQAAYDRYKYLNLTDSAYDNIGSLNHVNRSIILNASLFVENRTYTSEEQLVDGINNGEFDYLLHSLQPTNDEIIKALGDIYLSSDDFYYNYASAYFASIMIHEFIHSTHINNEVITYNACEMFEDDFRNQIVFSSWAQETQNAVNKLFSNLYLNRLTYGEAFLPLASGGGVSFHDFESYTAGSGAKDNIVSHGHKENMNYDQDTYDNNGNIAYKGYTNFTTGNTLEDDKRELLNFVV